MADNQDNDREDLSEEASPFRLEEMRRKGQVSQSRELTGLAALLAAAACCWIMTPQMGTQMLELMRDVFRTDLSARLDLGNISILQETLVKAGHALAVIGLPVCLAGFVIGALGSFAQIGAIFSWEPLQPDLSKINPISGFGRLFSVRHGVDSLRLVFKTAVVLIATYGLVKSQVMRAPGTLTLDAGTVMQVYGQSAKAVFLALFGILLVFAIFDFALQRREYGKQTRMTKAEAKQEHKEREGDPQIKARIRAVQREVARRRMMQAVKTATVVVTNPTHFAVALLYEKDMAAPRVVAKGADFVAQRIKAIAAEAGVPMVENVPLARTLHKTVKVNQHIPRALYQAVAEVLAYVYRLRGKV